jgi:hypothetical protein
MKAAEYRGGYNAMIPRNHMPVDCEFGFPHSLSFAVGERGAAPCSFKWKIGGTIGSAECQLDGG